MSMKSGTEGNETKVSFLQIMPNLDYSNKEVQTEQMWRSTSVNNSSCTFQCIYFPPLCKALPCAGQASANRKSTTLSWYPVLFTALLFIPHAFHPFLPSENGCF